MLRLVGCVRGGSGSASERLTSPLTVGSDLRKRSSAQRWAEPPWQLDPSTDPPVPVGIHGRWATRPGAADRSTSRWSPVRGRHSSLGSAAPRADDDAGGVHGRGGAAPPGLDDHRHRRRGWPPSRNRQQVAEAGRPAGSPAGWRHGDRPALGGAGSTSCWSATPTCLGPRWRGSWPLRGLLAATRPWCDTCAPSGASAGVGPPARPCRSRPPLVRRRRSTGQTAPTGGALWAGAAALLRGDLVLEPAPLLLVRSEPGPGPLAGGPGAVLRGRRRRARGGAPGQHGSAGGPRPSPVGAAPASPGVRRRPRVHLRRLLAGGRGQQGQGRAAVPRAEGGVAPGAGAGPAELDR